MEESKHSDSVFLQWDCAENAKKIQKDEAKKYCHDDTNK